MVPKANAIGGFAVRHIILALAVSAAFVTSAHSGTASCIDPAGNVFVQFMGDVTVENALTDDIGSLFITSKTTHIVEIRLTPESFDQSGIGGLFPGAASYDVFLYNANRVGISQSSIYTVGGGQGWVLYEPGGAGDIIVMVIDQDWAGATSGAGVVNICGGDGGGGGPGGGCGFDLNCDGVLDLNDLAGIVQCIISGSSSCDCNGDGVTNFTDFAACVDGFVPPDDPPCP